MANERSTLHALVERLAPRGRLISRERLRGGVSSIAERLDLERADGGLTSVVARHSADPGDHAHVTPEKFAYEWRVLQVVRAAGVPAPEPLLLDLEGAYFGTPAIVLGYIPGAPLFPGDDIDGWAAEMARAARQIHSVTPENTDLSALNVRLRDQMRDRLEVLRPWAAEDPFGARVHGALVAGLDAIDLSPALTHGDFWTGNTVWLAGRLEGVVDWGGAAVGDPRRDVADCRVELVMSRGADAADSFRRAYESAGGRPLQDLPYFDLYRGLEPYLETDHWIDGAIDLGEPISAEDAHERVAELLRRALASLSASSS